MSAKMSCAAAALALGLGALAMPHKATAQPYDEPGPYYGSGHVYGPGAFDAEGPRYDGPRGPSPDRYGAPPPPPIRVYDEEAGWRHRHLEGGYGGPVYHHPVPEGRWGWHPPRYDDRAPPRRPAFDADAVDFRPVGPRPVPDFGCITRRRETETEAGWRKIVTHRVCYVR